MITIVRCRSIQARSDLLEKSTEQLSFVQFICISRIDRSTAFAELWVNFTLEFNLLRKMMHVCWLTASLEIHRTIAILSGRFGNN